VLTLDGDNELVAAAKAHEAYIAGETLAVEVGYESLDDDLEPVKIDGRQLWIGVALA
jgi:isoleucyl-tRNA synthetase